MFIREVPQRLSDGRTVTYLQLVESYRDDDKAPRTRILASLGRLPGEGLRRLRQLQRSAQELLQRHAEPTAAAQPVPTFALAELEQIVDHALSRHVICDLWERLDLGEVLVELTMERHLRPDLPRDVLAAVAGTLVPGEGTPRGRCPGRVSSPGTPAELVALLVANLPRFARTLLGGLEHVLGPGEPTLLLHTDPVHARCVVVGPHGIPLLVVGCGPRGASVTDVVTAIRAMHAGRLVVSCPGAPRAWTAGSAPTGIASLDVLPPGQVPTGVPASILAAPGRYADVAPGLGAKEVRDAGLPGSRLVLVRTPEVRQVLVTDDLTTPVAALVGSWAIARETAARAARLPDDHVAVHGLATMLRATLERLGGRAWDQQLAMLGRHRAVVVRHGQGATMVHAPLDDELAALLDRLGAPPPMSAPLT